MHYYINPWIIYLINLSESLKSVCIIMVGLCFIAGFVIMLFSSDFGINNPIRYIKKLIIPLIICSILGIAIPSKETGIEMLVASTVTHENVDYTVKQIETLIDYISDKINEE